MGFGFSKGPKPLRVAVSAEVHIHHENLIKACVNKQPKKGAKSLTVRLQTWVDARLGRSSLGSCWIFKLRVTGEVCLLKTGDLSKHCEFLENFNLPNYAANDRLLAGVAEGG